MRQQDTAMAIAFKRAERQQRHLSDSATASGMRPGVKREDFWDWHGQPYFVKCSPHCVVSSIDPAFQACKTCGHSWRVPVEPNPQREDFATPMEYGEAVYQRSRRQDEACANTIPSRVCSTCAAKAARLHQPEPATQSFHHLNVCHGCGAFTCYPHTYWHGEDQSETLCHPCRMAAAKDGRLPKGTTKYGEERSA